MTLVSTVFKVVGTSLFWGATAVIFIAIYSIQRYVTYQRLSHFKGPRWAAWTELWLAKVTWTSQVHTVMREVNDRYGKSSDLSLWRYIIYKFQNDSVAMECLQN